MTTRRGGTAVRITAQDYETTAPGRVRAAQVAELFP